MIPPIGAEGKAVAELYTGAARTSFGPALPHAEQTNRGSMSDSIGQASPLIAIEWLQRCRRSRSGRRATPDSRIWAKVILARAAMANDSADSGWR
jgi:hypothetical protein